jgi:hypothetical protein
MKQTFYSSSGWETWGLEFKPVIPEGMSLIFDEDLLFEDGCGLRPSAVVNRWACELPTSKVPSDNSWPSYVRAVREWMEFGAEHGVDLLEDRDRLKALLSAYSVHRARGPLEARFKASTWNQHIAMLGKFYLWAIENGYTTALPFTYDYATGLFEGQMREMKVNQARRRQAKGHVTIKYLEDDFADLFLKGLARLEPDGSECTSGARSAKSPQRTASAGSRRTWRPAGRAARCVSAAWAASTSARTSPTCRTWRRTSPTFSEAGRG